MSTNNSNPTSRSFDTIIASIASFKKFLDKPTPFGQASWFKLISQFINNDEFKAKAPDMVTWYNKVLGEETARKEEAKLHHFDSTGVEHRWDETVIYLWVEAVRSMSYGYSRQKLINMVNVVKRHIKPIDGSLKDVDVLDSLIADINKFPDGKSMYGAETESRESRQRRYDYMQARLLSGFYRDHYMTVSRMSAKYIIETDKEIVEGVKLVSGLSTNDIKKHAEIKKISDLPAHVRETGMSSHAYGYILKLMGNGEYNSIGSTLVYMATMVANVKAAKSERSEKPAEVTKPATSIGEVTKLFSEKKFAECETLLNKMPSNPQVDAWKRTIANALKREVQKANAAHYETEQKAAELAEEEAMAETAANIFVGE